MQISQPIIEQQLNPNFVEGEGLERKGIFLGGVIDDYKRRFPKYKSDITDGYTWKTLSSALYMFFATIFSTVALGVLIQKVTKNRIGVEEYLIMNSLAGIYHAFLGCQPLLVLRPTGPITQILGMLSALSDSLEVDFWQYLFTTGVFVSLYMILIAGFEISRYIQKLTRYTHDIFAVFVCSIYIHDGISGMVQDFQDNNKSVFGKSLYELVIAILTFTISIWLNYAITWKVFTHKIREFMTDYSVTIAVFSTIILSYVWENENVTRITVPSMGVPTTYGRPWLVDLTGCQISTWIFGMLSAIPIVFFFFMDQNVSSLLTQQSYMMLSKGNYYHSSFLCMGIFNILGPLHGLPFVTGSLPHSPQFVKALTEYDQNLIPIKVNENRIAPFLMYLFIGVPVFIPQLITCIPVACINGILTFVGVAGILDCQLYERIILYLKSKEDFPKRYKVLKKQTIHLFTLSQVLILSFVWCINLSPANLLFSFIIVCIVPFRLYILPGFFSQEELDILDSERNSD